MRFGVILAAIAALWAIPARAVTIVLQQPTPEAGFHQKISLTALTGADTILATGIIPAVTFYTWESSTVLNGNEAITLICTVASGDPACHDGFTLTSSGYPVKSKTYLDLSIVGNDILIDWTMFAQDVCASVPEADRGVASGICGYGWYRGAPAQLDINVNGPSAESFGYTVTDITPNPVPEPATWALMILGLGFAGAALRRRYEIATVLPVTQMPSP